MYVKIKENVDPKIEMLLPHFRIINVEAKGDELMWGIWEISPYIVDRIITDEEMAEAKVIEHEIVALNKKLRWQKLELEAARRNEGG